MDAQLAEFAERGLTPTAPIAVSRSINVGAADVWAIISEAGNLTKVHPFCATNEVERWPGPDCRDRVRYRSGIHCRRDGLAWREGLGYDLALGPPSGKIAIARWSIESTGSDRCRLAVEVTSFVRNDVGAEVRRSYQDRVINKGIPPYLDSVVRGVAHYAETNTPVERNQFGAHEIYSPESI